MCSYYFEEKKTCMTSLFPRFSFFGKKHCKHGRVIMKIRNFQLVSGFFYIRYIICIILLYFALWRYNKTAVALSMCLSLIKSTVTVNIGCKLCKTVTIITKMWLNLKFPMLTNKKNATIKSIVTVYRMQTM
jgi:hypothetical protein